VVAATVVLTDGNVVTLGGAGPETTGYDLLGAWVGSEGCFGLTLDVTVRLTPNPEAVRTLLADFLSLDDAALAVSAIVASGIVPAALEMMDQGTIRAVEASIYAAGYPTDAAAVLLIELDGMAAGIAHDTLRVEGLCRAHGARDVRTASDEGERAKLWQGRKKAFGAMGRVSSHLVVQDAVVPRTQLPGVLAAIMQIGAEEGVTVCNVFHAGDGNLHPNVPYNANDPVERERVERTMRRIMDICVAAGGSVTGEHGIGLDKLEYMKLIFSNDSMEAMCRLREAFDPLRLANPGKVLPMRSCREWYGAPATRGMAAGVAAISDAGK
jgi:FAD/FMN-containing dehydrogenase